METVDVLFGGVPHQSNEEIANAISHMTPAEVEAFWKKAGSRKRQKYEVWSRQNPNSKFSGPNMSADAHVEDLQAELAHIGSIDWNSMRKPVHTFEDAKERARVADDGVEKARRRHEKSLLALKQARMLERKAHQEAAIDFEEESWAMETKHDEHMARLTALQQKAAEAQRLATEAQQRAADVAAMSTPEAIEREFMRRQAEKQRLADEKAAREAAEEEERRRQEEARQAQEEKKKQELRKLASSHRDAFQKQRQAKARLEAKTVVLVETALNNALDELNPKKTGFKVAPRVPYMRAGDSTKKLHHLGLTDEEKVEQYNATRAQAAEARRREQAEQEREVYEQTLREAEEQAAADAAAVAIAGPAGAESGVVAKSGAADPTSVCVEGDGWLFGAWFNSSSSEVTAETPAYEDKASTHGGGQHVAFKAGSGGQLQKSQVLFTSTEKEHRTRLTRAQVEEERRQEAEAKARAAEEKRRRDEFEAELARQAGEEARRAAEEAERSAAKQGCILAVAQAERSSPVAALRVLNEAKQEMERLGMLDAPELSAVATAIAFNSNAFVLGGKNDGYHTDALGGYVQREGRYTGRVRTYYLHESGVYYMFTHVDHNHGIKHPAMWVVSTTLGDPHGVWIGAVKDVDDGPELVDTWVTHKHHGQDWVPQLDVRTHESGWASGNADNGPSWTNLFGWMGGGESEPTPYASAAEATRHRSVTPPASLPSGSPSPPPSSTDDGRQRSVSPGVCQRQQTKGKENSLKNALAARRKDESSQEPDVIADAGGVETTGSQDMFAWLGLTAGCADDGAVCGDTSEDKEPLERKQTLMGNRQMLTETPESGTPFLDEDEDEQEAATKHTMPSRVPALIFGGRHDGFYAEALGAYHMVAAKKKVRGKRKVHYEHQSGNFFMYRYEPPKRKKREATPHLWVVSHALNDPNGFWIGQCAGPNDTPSQVSLWVTHKPGEAQWIRQHHVAARDDEATLYRYVTNDSSAA